MKQEEKSLLLQDLCARLPYGVKVKCGNTATKEICELVGINAEISSISIKDRWAKYYLENVASIKPYLRPMSSMTKEEKKELGNFAAASMFASQNKDPLAQLTREALLGDFFNKHHFDYRGLIPMGLALEAPEGMYNKKEANH